MALALSSQSNSGRKEEGEPLGEPKNWERAIKEQEIPKNLRKKALVRRN